MYDIDTYITINSLTETIATFIHSEPISTLITAKLCTLVICNHKTKSIENVIYFQSVVFILENVKIHRTKITIGQIMYLNKMITQVQYL